MTPTLPLTPFLWGLAVNLTLQVFDGVLTYKVIRYGVPEANPLVRDAIATWGVLWGLVFSKVFACALLMLIFAMRDQLRALATKAFTLTALVYGPIIVLSAYELLLHLSR